MTDTTWTALSAIATMLMAMATVGLALSTRSMAKETNTVARATLDEAKAVEEQTTTIEQQVEISRKTLLSSVLPWLTAGLPYQESQKYQSSESNAIGRQVSVSGPQVEIRDTNGTIEGHLLVENIGNGIAIINTEKIKIYRQNMESLPGVKITTTSPVLPPGRRSKIDFTIGPQCSSTKSAMTIGELAGGTTDQVFAISVSYSDIFESETMTGKFLVHGEHTEQPKLWRVRKIEYSFSDGKTVRVSL
ncbi:hypothetical protein ACFFRE_02045 [Aciditerrimonas ferrireducens]|uniref:Uncharacterized protein n=1 Tax=Aciditerrimonas ferrireducens TaxID=667306 RepID=A0ABV6C3R6_9ACTN